MRTSTLKTPPRTPAAKATAARPGPARPGRAAITLRLAGERVALRLPVRPIAVGAVLALLAVVLLALTVAVGHFALPLPDLIEVLTGGGRRADRFIVLERRLPRAVAALLVGAALGTAGAVFQSLTRNPLGSPDFIGLAAGASVGAVISITMLGGGQLRNTGFALVGCLVTGLLIYLLAYRDGVTGYRLVLVGIGMNALGLAVVHWLLTRARIDDAATAQSWLVGNLNNRSWGHVVPLAVVAVPAAAVLLWLRRRLDLLEMGDDAASALGIPIGRTRLVLFAVAVVLTAFAVSVAGPIAFVALAAPQIARRLTRTPGAALGTAALTGACLLLAGDLASREVFAPTQLPVGVATAALGGAYLCWLLTRQWRRGRG